MVLVCGVLYYLVLWVLYSLEVISLLLRFLGVLHRIRVSAIADIGAKIGRTIPKANRLLEDTIDVVVLYPAS